MKQQTASVTPNTFPEKFNNMFQGGPAYSEIVDAFLGAGRQSVKPKEITNYSFLEKIEVIPFPVHHEEMTLQEFLIY